MNVLLITTDQQQAQTIGAYGSRVCQTPNLDRLAAAGVRYDACRTQHPFCQPARATILTGQYSTTHGVTFNGIDLPDDAVEQSMATRFGEAGYRTGYFGKAHWASTFPFFPTGKLESVEGSAAMPDGWTGPYFGFDHAQLVLFGHTLRLAPVMGSFSWCFGPAPMGLHYGRWLYEEGIARGNELLRLMQPEAAGAGWDRTQTWRSEMPEEAHPTTWVTDRAIDWVDEQAATGAPFFGWVSFADPHHPLDPPARWFDMYSPDDVAEVLPDRTREAAGNKPPMHEAWSRGAATGTFDWANPGGANLSDRDLARMTAAYFGLISQLDHNIGRLLDRLDALGIADDTLVVMTTDHGEYLGAHNQIFKGPLHYDQLLRVAMIARGPGVAAGAGTAIADPVGTIDLQPTLLAAAGLPVPDYCEGQVLPGFTGGTAREHVLTEDDFDVLFRIPLRTVATDRYKLTVNLDAPNGVNELYDLQEDPGEFVNRWGDPDHAGVQADMLALLEEVGVRPLQRKLDKVGLVG